MHIRVANQPNSVARMWTFDADVTAFYETPSPVTTSATKKVGESLTLSLENFINKQANEEVVVEV